MKISKWGNSAAVRLSAFVTQTSGIGVDEPITINAQPGRIVIEKSRKQKKYTMNDLLAQTTARGAKLGREAAAQWLNKKPLGKEVL